MQIIPSRRIGIDLGTDNSVVAINGKVIASERTLVVYNDNTHEVFYGNDALQFVGYETEGLRVVWPMVEGKISDPAILADYLTFLIKKLGVRFRGSDKIANELIVAAIPCKLPSNYKSEIMGTCSRYARNTVLVDQPVAAAIGEGIDLGSVRVVKIFDIGGGTTDAIAISRAGIIRDSSAGIPIAGNTMDLAIQTFIRKEFGLKISLQTARQLKHEIGCSTDRSRCWRRLRGYDETGSVKSIRIEPEHISVALAEPIDQILKFAKDWFGKMVSTNPEVLNKLDEGFTLTGDRIDADRDVLMFTGGGSLLAGMTKRLSETLEIHVQGAQNPLTAAGVGASIIANSSDLIKRFEVSLTTWNGQLRDYSPDKAKLRLEQTTVNSRVAIPTS